MDSLDNTETTVIIADEQPLTRNGVTSLINQQENMRIVESAHSIDQAIEFCRLHRPKLLIMDCFLNDFGNTVVSRIKKVSPETNILVLTFCEDPMNIHLAVAEGASGYVLKSAPLELIVEAIRQTAQGNSFFPKALLPALIGAMKNQDKSEKAYNLTRRELEILGYIAKGLSSKEISLEIGISIRTVETHRHNIRSKTDAQSNSRLVEIANSLGVR